DEWSDDHLLRALSTLSRGFEVYFTDHLQLNADVSAFQRAKRIIPALHPAIRGLPDVHEYAGDMFDQILTGNVIGTSTVVYNRSRFPDAAFRPEYQNAGE